MLCPDHMGTLQLDGERIRQKQVVSPDLFHIFVFMEGHLCMWQQQVLDTVQVGLQQGDTGNVRKLIAEAVDAAVGVQIGGVWLPRPSFS